MPDIFVCGDVVHTEYRGGALCGASLVREIQAADLSVCNFEAPIQGHGRPIIKSGPHLSQPREVISQLREEGFDLLLLANNHIMDYGEAALGATLEAVGEQGLGAIGAGEDADAAYRPVVQEIDGVRIGMVNACEAQFGVLDLNAPKGAAGYGWINHPRLDRTVLELKRDCDFVLVFSHAGLEKWPIPQKEWRERYRHLCALGADAVLGCHPHVPQGWEWWGDSLIVYSLGNFQFNRKRPATGQSHHSYAVKLRLQRDRPMTFEPVFHHTENGVVELSSASERIDLDALNRKLEPGEYEARHEAMSLKTYHGRMAQRLARCSSKFPTDGTVTGTLRELAATALGRRRGRVDRNILMLHTLRNEAFYYAVRHALEIIRRDGNQRL